MVKNKEVKFYISFSDGRPCAGHFVVLINFYLCPMRRRPFHSVLHFQPLAAVSGVSGFLVRCALLLLCAAARGDISNASVDASAISGAAFVRPSARLLSSLLRTIFKFGRFNSAPPPAADGSKSGTRPHSSQIFPDLREASHQV
jgi:hypothetical protein